MQIDQQIKYGDKILLHSLDNPQIFLNCRNSSEYSVFMIESDQNIIEYPNTFELVFTIHPKLNYQAQKELQKNLKDENKVKNDNKIECLKKRSEIEKQENQKIIKKMEKQLVKIGSEIQIYHIYSQCYLKSSAKKNTNSSNLFCLKLSKKARKGNLFQIKIDDQNNQQKSDYFLTYNDPFIFESIKFKKSNLTTKDLPPFIYQNNKSNSKNNFNSLNILEYEKMSTINKSITTIPIFESLENIKVYHAGHKRDSESFFKAINVDYIEETEDQNCIRWGDYVRIGNNFENKEKDNKLEGVFFSEINVAGNFPSVYLEVNQNYSYENFSSIFQILPNDVNFLGKKIVNPEKIQNTQLRHVLSGKKLCFNGNKICLEQSQNVVLQQKTLQTKNFNTLSTICNDDNTENLFLKEKKGNDKENNNNFEQDKNCKNNNCLLLLNVQNKEQNLFYNISNFKIKNKLSQVTVYLEEEAVMIMNQDLIEKIDNAFIQSDYFQPIFQPMNALGRHIFMIGIEKNNNNIKESQFFFKKVCFEDIILLLELHSLCFHLVFFSFLAGQNSSIFNNGDKILKDLYIWIKNGDKQQQQRQNLIRESGILDVLMKILFEIYSLQIMYGKETGIKIEIFKFVLTLKNLLEIITEKNYCNSIYVYQWYFLFKQILIDKNVFEKFRFDLLLNQLFQTTQLNVGVKEDLNQLIECLKIEKQNIKILLLINAFCKFNAFRELSEQESIIELLLGNKENRETIFQQLKADNQDIFIENSAEEKIYINRKFINQIQVDQLVQNINLIIELAKGGVHLIEKYVFYLFPGKLCVAIFQSNDTNFSIKSAILDLFTSTYLQLDFFNLYCEDMESQKDYCIFLSKKKMNQVNYQLKILKISIVLIQSNSFSIIQIQFKIIFVFCKVKRNWKLQINNNLFYLDT
ncbi:hypothetical protein IMG5_055050 [Ichthyophthirius multifiliis]|uniref:Uncharacterized protein n=1 Tax=Ichthyophthirius multifiliis TaxID=5932 RepID=G0QN33_ICHMU|nr:hypothetical protein IMG5_055050 [Ichthyophthirius multifiliis]EGR33362.1 hypothetical protein IMG5_055050 [Ichthyophthirius multifiliis]|eukprot:XP_004037348.1 hypothetical protein IMG5_055050 [Ichthyophthirius multifiliis]